MTRQDQKRIARVLCSSYQRSLLNAIEKFPESWDGCHVRALLAYLVNRDMDYKIVTRAYNEIVRSSQWEDMDV